MDFDNDVSKQVSKLLQAYGSDAVTCLETLASLLKNRLDQEEARKKQGQGGHVNNDTQARAARPSLRDSLSTSGNVENIVLQTLQMEQDASSSSTNYETLVQAGINVLRYWSSLQPTSTDQVIIDPLCELMTKFPKNETIQESACVRLSKQMALLAPPVPSAQKSFRATKESQIQRILFPVLQAMNWHRNNPVIWNAGMIVVTRLLIKSFSAADLAERQAQAMKLIDLTGGLSIFFDSLLKQTTSDKAIQSELKIHVCHALAALALSNPTNQALIAQQPGLSRVLDTMKLNTYHLPLQLSLMHLLASLAYGTESKSILIVKGGLDCILTSMKDHPMESSIQATGCRAIANLFAGTSDDIRIKGALCIKPILRGMRMHPPQVDTTTNGADDNGNDSETSIRYCEHDDSSVQIHSYGCAALRNLSKVHSRPIVEAGGIATLLLTLAEYSQRPSIQEHGWGALYNLMEIGTTEDCLSVYTEGGLKTLLDILHSYTSHSRIQLVGLRCLACLAATDKLQILEKMVEGKAIDLVLSALYRHDKSGHGELLLSCCNILINLTRNNPDFQAFVIVKNGINVLIMVIQNTPNDYRIQLAACQIIKFLCRDNLPQAVASASLLPFLLGLAETHSDHHELFGCILETLGYMATLPRVQKKLVRSHGLEDLFPIIQKHFDDLGLLDLGITFLSQCSHDKDATLWMKNHDVIPFLQGVMTHLPRRSHTRIIAQELMDHLQTTRVLLGKFSRRRKVVTSV